MTTIINLYGGPSAGKSTASAFLYYKCKVGGYNTELVREYVKEWAYEARYISIYDQLYILGKQSRKESFLYGKVDYIITDSPVMLAAYYAEKYCPPDFASGIKEAARAFYKQSEIDGHKHHHVVLQRNSPYKKEGRYQDEAEAKEIDAGIKNLLTASNLPFEEVLSDEKDLSSFYGKLIKK